MNFVGASECQLEYIWTMEQPAEENIQELTKRDEEELKVLENLVTSTQKKIDMARRKFGLPKEGMATRSKGAAAQPRKYHG